MGCCLLRLGYAVYNSSLHKIALLHYPVLWIQSLRCYYGRNGEVPARKTGEELSKREAAEMNRAFKESGTTTTGRSSGIDHGIH